MQANLPHLQIAGYVTLPEMQNLPKNEKFPQGVFSPITDLLYFKQKHATVFFLSLLLAQH